MKSPRDSNSIYAPRRPFMDWHWFNTASRKIASRFCLVSPGSEAQGILHLLRGPRARSNPRPSRTRGSKVRIWSDSDSAAYRSARSAAADATSSEAGSEGSWSEEGITALREIQLLKVVLRKHLYLFMEKLALRNSNEFWKIFYLYHFILLKI